MLTISKRILIVSEDEKSSKLYLESFKKDEKLKRDLSSVQIQVVHPKNHDPVGLVNKAKDLQKKARRERNSYDEIWIVLDRDRHTNIATALNTAAANKFKVALSVICFEYWILLHFEQTTMSFKKCDDVIKYIKKNHLKTYQKNDNSYEILKDRTQIAITNGRWVEKQCENDLARGIKNYNLHAYTDIHLLIEKILNPNAHWLKK